MRSAEENKLEKDLRKWFNKLQRKIQKLIDTYYEDELFFLHINKIYTIVEEMKPEYRAILLKHGLTQFYNARETTTTLYTIQQKKVSTKAGLYEPQLIREEDVGLFRTNPQIEDSLRYNTFQASDTTLARVTQNITNNLADSYHEGLGIRDAGRRITKEFAGLKGWESRRIARTEINSAQNEGAFSAYDELGVEYQMWWTGNDNRVRDSHRPLHGHIVAVGNTFSNGLLYPGDKSGPIKEWINCRCTSIPYIIPLGKMAPPGLTEFTEDQLIDIPGYMPISVEDALNGEYPLEYYTEGGVIDQYKNQGINTQLFSEAYDIHLDHSLSKAPFAVPVGDFSEFGINDELLDLLQRFQKKRFGAEKEYGFAFKLDGKILTKEFRGGTNDIVISSPSKKHGTVHYHTEDGFNSLSHQDIKGFLEVKREKLSIAMSKKETWLMQKTNSEKVFTNKEIKKITKEIKGYEQKQLDKMQKEYKKRQRKINRIKNPQKRKLAQKEFDEYLNNEFLDKHNKELGDKILDCFKNNKDLKVKRVMNTPVNKRDIDDFPDIGLDKGTYNKYKNLKRSTPINSKVKDIDKYALTENKEKIHITKTELKEYRKLKAQKDAGILKDTSDIRKLREYEQQLQFNKYYKKYGNKLPKDKVDAQIYKNLANLPHIRKKLGKTTEVLFKIDKSKFAHKGFDDDLWSEKGIRESLDGFVDKNDLKDVSKAIFDYTQEARKHPNESATTYDKNFNPISKFIPGDSETEIKIPQEDIDMVKNSYFGLVGHSHIKSKIPLPDLDDILYGNVALNSKYNVIYAPDYGVTLIKQTKPKSKPNKNLIQNSYKEANRKRKNFLNNKTTKLKEEYKKELKHKNISDIKQRSDLRNIEDIVRHSDFEIQCEYFNKELKQYGIELIYIKP